MKCRCLGSSRRQRNAFFQYYARKRRCFWRRNRATRDGGFRRMDFTCGPFVLFAGRRGTLVTRKFAPRHLGSFGQGKRENRGRAPPVYEQRPFHRALGPTCRVGTCNKKDQFQRVLSGEGGAYIVSMPRQASSKSTALYSTDECGNCSGGGRQESVGWMAACAHAERSSEALNLPDPDAFSNSESPPATRASDALPTASVLLFLISTANCRCPPDSSNS